MTKTLAGEPLDLDDGPAHGRDLFVVDGNNLAHRAFHALPDGIATSWGLPSNAILGFANLFFKLLCDYRPRGALVAWDRKPTERLASAADYKAGRKPMAPALAQQFPHFPEIVAAFGYPSIAVDGWEADDLIATASARAEAAGLTSCLLSTDRDAFQLVSDRTCLMMTPRGTSAPEVYTPERILKRYGIGPALIPDFIALKGDSADHIAPVPGIGEKTAAQLLAKYGSLEGVIAHVDELSPARRKAIVEHTTSARAARALATLRRDLPIPDAAQPEVLVAHRPDRSTMKATFERYARVTGATSVARCGVRYINQIAVEPGTDLADYLLTAPTLAPTLPQEMADLFMRVVVSKPPAKVILTEALERPHQRPLGGAGPELAVILDIDAFYDDASFAVDDPKLWETLELLRKVKNEVFFGCLTEKALEAYRR